MNYKSTILLPENKLSMRANLPELSKKIIQFWNETDLYEKMKQNKTGKPFFLMMGPPYATGNLHLGHMVNIMKKSMIILYKYNIGYDIDVIPGWDCHGLPIELKVEEKTKQSRRTKNLSEILDFRKSCNEFAEEWIQKQMEQMKTMGFVADYKNLYKTTQIKAEVSVIKTLFCALMNGFLYREARPLMWSIVEKTTLSDAETQHEDHTSLSLDVFFQINTGPLVDYSVVIWTTTPWTIVANRAVAFNPNISYSLVHIGSYKLILAKELIKNTAERLKQNFQHIRDLDIIELNFTMLNPFGKTVPLISSSHVTNQTGTGFVHIAPAHGEEDFLLGKKYNLEIIDYVDEEGFYKTNTPVLGGLHIFNDQKKIVSLLTNVLSETYYKHSYPYSQRGKVPMIFKLSYQCFVELNKSGIRERALKAIENVQWLPVESKNRIRSMVQDRGDWCLTRQRSWGVPVMIFFHKKTGLIIRDSGVNKRILEELAEKGSDMWYDNPKRFLSNYNADEYEAVMDIIDVWFESGVVHDYISPKADLYLEGSDQHRGFFQSSLLAKMINPENFEPPYKSVLTHGFILDSSGHKMSKSLGNIISVEDIIENYGVDIARMVVISSDYCGDIIINKDTFSKQSDNYRKIRNVLRYLVGITKTNIGEKINFDNLQPLEEWMLKKVADLDTDYLYLLENDYQIKQIFESVYRFISNDVSAFYTEINKDTIYCDAEDSTQRKNVLNVMSIIRDFIIKWLKPVLVITIEEVYQINHPGTSVHEKRINNIEKNWSCFNKSYDLIEQLREKTKIWAKELELSREKKEIKTNIEAVVWDSIDESHKELLKKIAMLSGVENYQGPLKITRSDLNVCKRCMRQPTSKELCVRCEKVMKEKGEEHTLKD